MRRLKVMLYAVALCGNSAQAATYISGAVSQSYFASTSNANGGSSGSGQNPQGSGGSFVNGDPAYTGFYGFTIDPAAAAVSVTINGKASSAAADASLGAQWLNPNSGTVNLDYDWALSGDTGTTFNSLVQFSPLSGSDVWRYSFVADANELFTMAYGVTGSGDLSEIDGWDIYVNDVLALGLSDPLDPTAAGTFNLALTPGQSYTIGLRNFAELTLQSPIANDVDRVGSLQGRFRWSIVQAGVPEPSTWAMMILGLGLIGGAMRRRQQVDYSFA